MSYVQNFTLQKGERMQKLFRSLIAVAGLASLAACGDDVSVTAPNNPLVITGAPVTAVSVGAKVQLQASEAATWTTSAANVATVDATGLVTAVAAGTASITATATADVNKKASVTITVSSAVRSVTVSPPTAVLIPGGTLGFVANVDRDAGVAGTVTWSSSNTAVATVNASTGVVTAVAVGSATITAAATAAPTVTGSAVVTVRAPVAATISIQNITQAFTPGSPTINNNNVFGTIDVNMNVDPGEQVVQRVEVLIDNVVACTQNLTPAQSEEIRIAAAFEDIQDAIVSCQINTAKFDTTTGVAAYFNGPRTISARAVIAGGNDVATPTTPLIFNNVSGVIATITNDNAPDPNSAIHPGTGLQWIGGGATLKLIGVSYVSGTTVASVNCTIFSKDPFNFVLTNGTATQAYSGTSTWSATDKDLNGYNTPTLLATTGESVACPSAVLSNGQPLPAPSGSTLLNFGPFPGQLTNGAQPVLQFFRVDNLAPGAAAANPGVTQTAITLGALASPWVNATTSFAPNATTTNALGIPALSVLNAFAGATDIEEGVDAITVTVYAPAAGGTLSGSAANCSLTGLTAVANGGALAATTVSTAYPLRIVFKDALGNQTCLDQASIGADFVAPTIVTVTGPAANSFFVSQAAMPDFVFSVTDNASGFGAEPVVVRIVRLDSANTAFCVIGTGTGCTANDTILTFDPTRALTNSGYYTITYQVKDQAGNLTTATTITYLLDQVAPTWSGGVSLPSVIAGATTNTFTATPADNLDLDDVFGVVDYPTIDIRYPNQSLGDYGAPLQMGGTAIGYAVANWMRCVNNPADFATTTNLPTQIGLVVTDQAQNQTGTLSPLFGANAQPCGAVGATAINTFGPTVATLPATKTEVDIDGANLATNSATTATLTAVADVPINTSADPFARVDFYYETAPGSNVWRLAGSATGALAQTPTTRTYTYTFVWDPDANVPSAALPGASVAVMAIGVDAQGDAVRTVPASVLIVP